MFSGRQEHDFDWLCETYSCKVFRPSSSVCDILMENKALVCELQAGRREGCFGSEEVTDRIITRCWYRPCWWKYPPREQGMLWDVFVFTPLLWRYYTWLIYSNHLDKPPASSHNFHSVVHPIQAMEAVTICRETFANAFITDWYLKSESLNFNATCVTMVAKFLYYMSLWRWTLEIIINLSGFFWMVFSSTFFFGDVFDGGY